MNETKPDKTGISLALGGGGARGIAHVHVLKALDDLGVKPLEIASSSIGSIIGAGYASGMSGRDIEDFLVESFTNRTAVLAKMWKLRPEPIKNWFSGAKSAAPFGQTDIEKVLDLFLPKSLPENIESLSIPLKITATDYYGNALKILKTGNLAKAIAASAAIPVVFVPVVIDGCVLIDGGINNPLPFDLLDQDNNLTIAVDVVGLPRGSVKINQGKAEATIPGRIDLGFGASQLMMQAITNIKLAARPPDLFIRPNVDAFRVLDFLKVREILTATLPVYEETKRGLEKLLIASDKTISLKP